MNESPNQPLPSEPVVIPPAVTTASPVGPQVATPKGPEKLALWSMILGIVSVVLIILIPISIIAAIVAIVLGAIVLSKHHSGKGKALTGIITGGFALVAIVPLIAITVVAFNSVNERANESAQKALQQEASQLENVATNKTTVDTPCYTYDIPSGFEYNDASAHCTTSVNIPKGDSLTRIVVKPNTGAIGTLSDVVATLNKGLKNSDPNSAGVIDQKELTVNGNTVYYITYKDSYDLLFGNYIIPQQTTLKDENDTTITAYTVAGYANLPQLKEVLDSLTTK